MRPPRPSRHGRDGLVVGLERWVIAAIFVVLIYLMVTA